MKKCPFCQAEIQENARFCLYCMHPLVEKQVLAAKKNRSIWVLLSIAASILLLITAITLFVRGDRPAPSAGTPQIDSVISEQHPTSTLPDSPSPDTPLSTENTATPSAPDSSVPVQMPGVTVPVHPPNNTSPGESTPATTPADTEPTGTAPAATEPAVTTPVATAPVETTPTQTEPSETAPTVAEPTYTYETSNGIPGTLGYRTSYALSVPLEQEDDVPFHPAGSDVFLWYPATASDVPDESYVNAYVVSGNCAYVRCGIYTVSATTDTGGKVVAVRNAALGDIVMLTLAKSVIAIGPHALSNNYEFKYLCIKGDQIDIDTTAFPPLSKRWYQIVIRCSANCKNSSGEYIKDIVGRYGATWEEWNG